jgi:ACS family tartrate transporter-like MFS transporter
LLHDHHLPATGTAAAGAIALINSVGNLGGIVGPVRLGWVKDTTNNFSSGFYFLAFWAFLADIAVVSALRAPKRVAPGYGAPAE